MAGADNMTRRSRSSPRSAADVPSLALTAVPDKLECEEAVIGFMFRGNGAR